MNEVVPVALGVVIGAMVGLLTARYKPWLWVTVSIIIGCLATVLTGEWRISWAFLLIDIPLIGLFSALGFLVVRQLRQRKLIAPPLR
jgi:hypothetical protein